MTHADSFARSLGVVLALAVLASAGAGCMYRGPVSAADLRTLDGVRLGDKVPLVSGDDVTVDSSTRLVVRDKAGAAIGVPLAGARYDAAADRLTVVTDDGVRSLGHASTRVFAVETLSPARSIAFPLLGLGIVASVAATAFVGFAAAVVSGYGG